LFTLRTSPSGELVCTNGSDARVHLQLMRRAVCTAWIPLDDRLDVSVRAFGYKLVTILDVVQAAGSTSNVARCTEGLQIT
jgi:hypothetical protein